MINKMLKTIKTFGLISQNDKIIIGLSGGADSVALTYALFCVKETFNLELYAVHVNHMLRGKQADDDEQFCKNFCQHLGIEIETYRADVAKRAAELKTSFENAGRIIRYDIFETVKKLRNADKIAIAHNKGDNVETVLINMLRGTGLKGLAGISPKRGDIIRPLIDISRMEIIKFIEDKNLAYVEDYTNAQNDYRRNKIRNVLIPYLEENFNESIIESISEMSDILSAENELIEEMALKAYKRARTVDGLNIEILKSYHISLIKRAIRLAIQDKCGTLYNIANIHIENILNMIYTSNNKSINLPNGYIVKKEYVTLSITDKVVETKPFSYNIIIGEKIFIPEVGQTVLVTKEETDMGIDCYSIDYNKIKNPNMLNIRNRREADRINIENVGYKKLKNIFIDNKIKKDLRDKILILADDLTPVYVQDIRVNSDYYVDTDTKEKLFIYIWGGIDER